jgi:hypothetical protein
MRISQTLTTRQRRVTFDFRTVPARRADLERIAWGGIEHDTAGGFFASFRWACARSTARTRSSNPSANWLSPRAVHIGESEMIDGKPGGLAVAVGARTSASPVREKSLSRRPRKDLVAGSGFSFDNRSEHDLRRIPEPWSLYAAEPKAQ